MSPAASSSNVWPITIDDVRAAEARIRPHLPRTALRRYPPLEAAVGHVAELWVKHESHLPTGSFKARNGLSALTALGDEARRRGVVAATRGNHGQSLAWAGQLLGIPVTLCVPRGNNPEKNEGMRGFGATVVEEGRDYDEAVGVADGLVRERGLTLVHSTNDRQVIAGAATLSLELLEERPSIDAIVVAVGGGSQAVGALVAARALAPHVAVYGVQAARASAAHDSWHARHPVETESADTFADGLATRKSYPFTFGALLEGLTGFVAVSEARIADAVRLYLSKTHHLAEGAGATGLAGLLELAPKLAGQRVAVILSGSNIDQETLRRVVNREL